MSIPESFLVSTRNLESILTHLRKVPEVPAAFDNKYLESAGFTDPSDMLVIQLCREIGLIDENGAPTSLFELYRDPRRSNIALAKGVLNGYQALFEQQPEAHRLGPDDLTREIAALSDGKSDLVLKYMTNTFLMLVKYTGREAIEKVLEDNISSSARKDESEHKQSDSSLPDAEYPKKDSPLPQEEFDHTSEVKPDNKVEIDANSNHYSTDGKSNGNGFSASNNNEIKKLLQLARLRKTTLLYKTGKLEEFLDSFDDGFTYNPSECTPGEVQQAVHLLLKRIEILERFQKYDELVSACTETIKYFHNAGGITKEKQYQSQLNNLYLKRVNCAIESKNDEEALKVISETIAFFRDDQEQFQFLIQMLYKKGELLEQLNMEEEAIDTYNQIIKSCSDHQKAERHQPIPSFFRCETKENQINNGIS